jgi:endonuclease/exonuclease/phosphatase family metal-dependent hydrolase
VRLTVATFNLRNGLARDGRHCWPLRRRATAAVLAGLDADVIGLQEAFGFQARWLHRRLGRRAYAMVGDGRSPRRSGERTSVLVRRSTLTVVEARTRWFGAEPDRPGTRLPGASFPRTVTVVRLRPAAGGPELVAANTHLDEHLEANRVTAADQLVGWLGEGPAVVVGDLNAEPGTAPLTRLHAAGLRDVLGPDAPGTNHDFTGRTDGRRIDHVLVSPHWTVESARVVTDRPGGRLPSDHWPVVARVVATSDTAVSRGVVAAVACEGTHARQDPRPGRSPGPQPRRARRAGPGDP